MLEGRRIESNKTILNCTVSQEARLLLEEQAKSYVLDKLILEQLADTLEEAIEHCPRRSTVN